MKYVMLCLCILLSACSTSYLATPDEKPKLNIPDPEPLSLRKVEYIVLTKENANQIMSDLEAQGIEPVIFGLTGDGYKALSMNVDDIKNYLLIQKKILILYREYYEN